MPDTDDSPRTTRRTVLGLAASGTTGFVLNALTQTSVGRGSDTPRGARDGSNRSRRPSETADRSDLCYDVDVRPPYVVGTDAELTASVRIAGPQMATVEFHYRKIRDERRQHRVVHAADVTGPTETTVHKRISGLEPRETYKYRAVMHVSFEDDREIVCSGEHELSSGRDVEGEIEYDTCSTATVRGGDFDVVSAAIVAYARPPDEDSYRPIVYSYRTETASEETVIDASDGRVSGREEWDVASGRVIHFVNAYTDEEAVGHVHGDMYRRNQHYDRCLEEIVPSEERSETRTDSAERR